MKTAEKIWSEIGEVLSITEIQEIQLDAFKAGERFAAEIVKQEIAQWLVGTTGDNTKVEIEESCCKAILDDANNRTELP